MKWRVAPTAMFTKSYMDNRFKKGFRTFGTITLRNPSSPDGVALVVDSWNLQDGTSISGKYQADKNTRYWKQVDRMAWVSSPTKTITSTAAKFIQYPSQLIASFCEQYGFPTIDPMETALAAKNYGPSTDGARSLEGMTDKPNKFDTAPFMGAYKNAYNQRGEYFMGCKQQAVLGCNRSTSTDNPFGEFIITGE
jgi:hypothetical protein